MGGKLDRALVLLALVAAHCGGGAQPSTGDAAAPWTLAAEAAELTMTPGGAKAVWFVLTDGAGRPVRDQVVSFSLAAQDGTDGRGATLASDTGVTDAAGRASTQVNAGLPTQLRVTAQTTNAAPAVALVWVSSTPFRNVEVAFYIVNAAAGDAATTSSVDVLFFDSASCAEATLADTAKQPRAKRTVAVNDMTLFEDVAVNDRHAVVGSGRDAAGHLVAFGCLDLEGFVLTADATMRVDVPLDQPRIEATGTFSVVSSFRFPEALAVAREVAAPWTDLADCPLDPGQRWLDCTVDALGSSDPLDCEPAADEGALAASIMALRGEPDSSSAGCRPATIGGNASLDAEIAGLFPAGSSRPPLLADLPLLGAEALQVLDDLALQSTLELRPTIESGRLAVTHTFSSATLGVGSRLATVSLRLLGLPVLSANTTATFRNGGLELDQHGITLRLGTVARAGFSALVLAPRELPTSTGDLVTTLLDLARTSAGDATGCAALDAVVCKRLQMNGGCVLKACTDGKQALTARLERGFENADGDGLDLLLLSGSSPVFDQDGDLVADHLGTAGPSPSAPGLWAAALRPRAGKVTFSGIWNATRK